MMLRALSLSILGLSFCACGGSKAGAPSASTPRPAPLGDVQRIAKACAASPGKADDYRTAKGLATRLVGRWVVCGSDAGDGKMVAYDFAADGTWSRLERRGERSWVALPRLPDRDDNGGMYKLLTHDDFVAATDDTTQADAFFVKPYIVRPFEIWAFETSPRRAIVVSYGHLSYLVPIAR